MQYTTILTHQPGTLWQAFVPVLPDCQVQGATRNEVLDKIKTRIKDISLHMEVLQLQVSTQEESSEVKQNTDTDVSDEIPWHWVGHFEDDPSWSKLFDEIEKERDLRMIGGIEDGTE